MSVGGIYSQLDTAMIDTTCFCHFAFSDYQRSIKYPYKISSSPRIVCN